MVFYSNNFTFNNVYSDGTNIHLVTEDEEILNNYGLPFNINEENTEITLSFCYSKDDKPLEWTYEDIVGFLSWMITDDYCEFISDDNEDIIYFLKGVSYTKRFTNSMMGIIDVTFKSLSPYGYRHSIRQTRKNNTRFKVQNYSNVDNNYKPIITLSNINSDTITLTNTTTGKDSFTINNLTNSDVIYIDNLMGTITDANGNNKIMDSNRSWIELCKGVNNIVITGECSVKVESYFPMMV